VTTSVETVSGHVKNATLAPAQAEPQQAALTLVFDGANFGTIDASDCCTVQIVDCSKVCMERVPWFFAVGECDLMKTETAYVYIAANSRHTNVKTVSGDIFLGSCNDAISTSGHIRISGDCSSAQTTSGDIAVTGACKTARSTSGDIYVHKPCDAFSVSGVVLSV